MKLELVLLTLSFQWVAAGLTFPFLLPKNGSQAFYVSGGIRVVANEETQVYEGTSALTERWGLWRCLDSSCCQRDHLSLEA